MEHCRPTCEESHMPHARALELGQPILTSAEFSDRDSSHFRLVLILGTGLE